MRRRDVLRVGCATIGAAASGAATVGGAPADVAATGTVSDADEVFEPLDVLSLPGAKELVVDDGVAYVAVTDGFATVDASDPTDLGLLAERRDLLSDHEDGPLVDVYDGKVGGDHYAVGGPANPTSEDVPHAAVVFDVSDPAAPERVLVHETEFYHHNVDVDDGTLYLCGNDGDRNPLVCVDVETGEELGRWSVVDADERWADVHHRLYMLHDVWVEDDVAHCAYWNAGTWLVDVSDPSDPSPVADLRGLDPTEQAEYTDDEAERARMRLPGNDHFAMPLRCEPSEQPGADAPGTERPANCATDERLIALNEEAWAGGPNAPESDLGGVELWDVDAGERLARIEAPFTTDATFQGMWTTAHNFEFAGDRLYTSWYRGGVKIHDVSDPADPELYAHWRDEDATSFWTAQRAGDAVLASSWRDHSRDDPEAGAAIYAFPDPDEPVATPDDGVLPTADGGAATGLLAGAAALGAAALVRRLRSTPRER